jgi:arsenate reductase
MAEGLLRQLAKDRFESLSAGTRPTTLNPMAVKAMAEIGVDISLQISKAPDAFADPNVDVVITVCDRANDNCPVYFDATERLHWRLDDPAEATGTEDERMAVFRRVRDEIHGRIRKFLDTDGRRFE